MLSATLMALLLGQAPDLAAQRAGTLARMQRVMGPLPGEAKRAPLEPRLVSEEDAGRFTRRKLTLAVEPGDRLPVYLLIPKSPAVKRPAIVALHQTNRPLGKGGPAGLGDRPDQQYAAQLAERGYIVIVPDYINMGEYKVNPYAMGYASATMKGIWNHMRCVDYLQSLPEVDGRRIGAIGHSLGGHNSIFLAAFDERVKCAVSSCGFCSFPSYKKGDLTGWSHDGYMPRIRTEFHRDPKQMPFDFPEVIAALAPRPFFTSSPLHDDNFDVQGVRDCIAGAAPTYQRLGAADKLRAIYPDSQHEFSDAARREAYEWLDRWLKAG